MMRARKALVIDAIRCQRKWDKGGGRLYHYTTSDCNANINESIDSLSRSLTPRSAPLLDLRQIDRIFPSEINS